MSFVQSEKIEKETEIKKEEIYIKEKKVEVLKIFEDEDKLNIEKENNFGFLSSPKKVEKKVEI